MRIFKTRVFDKWARKEDLSDAALFHAVIEMTDGLIDAELGGQVCKKRVPVSNRGKSGGARTLIAFRADERAFFMYGFAKNTRSNISNDELKALKLLATVLLNHTETELDRALRAKELIEITRSAVLQA
jgi:hypothetical protein